jgi:hypothetical protein
MLLAVVAAAGAAQSFAYVFHTGADAERLHVTLVYETHWMEGMNNALVLRILPATLCASVLFVADRLMVRTAWLRQERLRRAAAGRHGRGAAGGRLGGSGGTSHWRPDHGLLRHDGAVFRPAGLPAPSGTWSIASLYLRHNLSAD